MRADPRLDPGGDPRPSVHLCPEGATLPPRPPLNGLSFGSRRSASNPILPFREQSSLLIEVILLAVLLGSLIGGLAYLVTKHRRGYAADPPGPRDGARLGKKTANSSSTAPRLSRRATARFSRRGTLQSIEL